MAGRKAGFAHVSHVGAWISASPRVQRVGAAAVGLVLLAGLAGVVTHRPGTLSEPVALAAAVGPVDAAVASPAAAPDGARSSTVHGSRSKPAPHVQPKAKPAPKPAARRADWAYLAPRIRGCESGSGPGSPANYKAKNPTTSASGAYQIVDSTWGGRYGVQHASDATPEQQDAVAYELYQRRGTADWAPSASCWR